MKPIYKKYLKTIALIWAGSFVLLFVVYMLALAPQQKNKKRVERQLAEKTKQYDIAVKAAQEETKIQLNEQLEQLQDRFKHFVVGFDESANLTFEISQIANQNNVSSFSVKTKNANKRSETDDYKYISENYIDISFAAGFNQFAALLKDLFPVQTHLLQGPFNVLCGH